jgi:serine/threonine protein kinase
VYEFGELERGRPYYVMELLEGMDLRKLLTLHGRFSPKEVLQLIEPVCSAVQAAHNAGFIHRDLKANNVLIVDGGDKRVVKLLDFGIAKMYQAEASGQGLTEPGMFLGTAHNMAPEQIRCEKLDTRADIYALGVLIYQLLTGHYPFEAEDPRQIVLLHLQAPPPRPSSRAPVPPAVDAVVLKCLEKKAERRFGSADDLIAALRAAVGEEPEDAGGETTPAVGIYVEIAQGEDEEMSDAIFEDVTQVLDMIEQDLAERQYVFPLRTATALLGVRPLDADRDVSEARTDAYELACELRSGLSQRPDPHPDVRISISVTVAEAQCRSAAAGIEVTGGPLLEVGAWSTEKYVLTA